MADEELIEGIQQKLESNIELNNTNYEEKEKEEKNIEKQETELTDDMFRKPGTRIDVGSEIYIYRVSNVDLVNETFDATFEIEFQWRATKEEYIRCKQDPLNYIPTIVPTFKFANGKMDQFEIEEQNGNKGYRAVKEGDIGSWNRTIGKPRYPVYNMCYYHFNGTFTEQFELKNFPFDVQDLQISIEAEDDTDTMLFVATYKIWNKGYFGYQSMKYSALQEYTVHPPFIECGLIYGTSFSTLNIRMKIERNYGVYFWKIALFAFVVTGLVFSFHIFVFIYIMYTICN